MTIVSRENYDHFWSEGFLICRSVFSADEISRFREFAKKTVGTEADLLADINIRELITDDRVLEIAATLLDDVPVFIGDGVLTCRATPSNWHKDNPGRYNRSLLDWQGRYPIIRFGIYFQDHSKHSGGVSVRKYSHNSPTHDEGEPVYGDTAIGDLIVWHGRTTHRASTSLLKGSGTPLFSYKIDKKLPSFLKKPYDHDRYALFFSLGAAGADLDHFVNYYATRQHAVVRAAKTNYDEEWIRSLDPSKVIIRDTREIVQSLPPEKVDVKHRDF